jgi:hypothetical protein
MAQVRRSLYHLSQGPDVLLQTDLEKDLAFIRVLQGESKLGFGLCNMSDDNQ